MALIILVATAVLAPCFLIYGVVQGIIQLRDGEYSAGVVLLACVAIPLWMVEEIARAVLFD